MIRDLAESLRALVAGEAHPGSELASAKVTFVAPVSTFQSAGTGVHVDFYLTQIAENRELRTNERTMRVSNGELAIEVAPPRIDCTYVVTVWNKATAIPGVEQELQEHRVLTQTLEVLLANPVLPRKYLQGLLAAQQPDLPMIAAQADGPASPDFWSGFETHVRPSITCRATLSLVVGREQHGPIMTTARIVVDGETRYLVGGTVYAAGSPPAPVAGAWVRVDETGEVSTTDAHGHFFFERLAPGTYHLTVRAPGFQDGAAQHAVPSPLYDVTLLPL